MMIIVPFLQLQFFLLSFQPFRVPLSVVSFDGIPPFSNALCLLDITWWSVGD
jgi:hypothetical protein